MVAYHVVEVASDGLVLFAIAGILPDKYEFDGLPELGSMIEVLASSEPCPMISTEWSLMMPFTSSHVAAAAVPENTSIAAMTEATICPLHDAALDSQGCDAALRLAVH